LSKATQILSERISRCGTSPIAVVPNSCLDLRLATCDLRIGLFSCRTDDPQSGWGAMLNLTAYGARGGTGTTLCLPVWPRWRRAIYDELRFPAALPCSLSSLRPWQAYTHASTGLGSVMAGAVEQANTALTPPNPQHRTALPTTLPAYRHPSFTPCTQQRERRLRLYACTPLLLYLTPLLLYRSTALPPSFLPSLTTQYLPTWSAVQTKAECPGTVGTVGTARSSPGYHQPTPSVTHLQYCLSAKRNPARSSMSE
jgi:hypothetical protein